MGVLETLSLAMGTAWTSGINLYATIAVLGLAGSYGIIHLPPNLEVLMNPLVIGFACLMYIIEFFADKVPYFDSVGMQLIPSFVSRLVPFSPGGRGGCQSCSRTRGDPWWGCGSRCSHGTKMATRLAINTSPEPFSNWTASVTEDVGVFVGYGRSSIIRC